MKQAGAHFTSSVRCTYCLEFFKISVFLEVLLVRGNVETRSGEECWKAKIDDFWEVEEFSVFYFLRYWLEFLDLTIFLWSGFWWSSRRFSRRFQTPKLFVSGYIWISLWNLIGLFAWSSIRRLQTEFCSRAVLEDLFINYFKLTKISPDSENFSELLILSLRVFDDSSEDFWFDHEQRNFVSFSTE